MKVKYIGESDCSLTKDKIYIATEEEGMYRIVDDTGEDYLFYKEEFKLV